MRFGLMESTIDAICGVLARHPAVEKAMLYGSRAKGNFKPGSDIDLTLLGAALDARQLAMIDEELDDLLLPYQIDLSIFAQLDHAKLREHIERVGVVFYHRTNGEAENRKSGCFGEDSWATVKAGWKSKQFQDCIEKIAYTTKIQRKDFLEAGAYPVVSQEDAFINGYWDDTDDVFRVETPLVVFGDHTKVLKYIDFDFVLGADGVKLLPPKEFLVPKFFYYQLQTAQLESLGYARHYKLLKELEIKFPDRAEQHRIVAILDEAFDGIATAKANAEKNLQNARALFESHLQTVFSQRGEGWVEKSFEDICNKITDGTHHSPKIQFSERKPGLFPYITSKNIRNNFMDLSNVTYIESSFHDEVYARCQPSLGDVLLTKDGASTGNVTLNTLDEPFSLLSSVCLIKTKPDLLNPAFLCYYLQSPVGLACIVGQMTGAAIKRIVLKDIKKAVITFPPLNEQEDVVLTLNSLLAETQHLESIYQQKLAALDELKKSLLHQAFSGQL